MKPELKELRGEIEAKRKELKSVFDEAGPDRDMTKVKSLDGDAAAKVEAIGQINAEINDLCTKAAPLEEEHSTLTKAQRELDALSESEGHPGHPTKGREGEVPNIKSLGEVFIESEAGAGKKGRLVEMPDVNVKALFETGAGWAPPTVRGPRVVDFATVPVQILDLIPTGATGQASIVYMEETTFENGADTVKEGGKKPEGKLGLTQRTIPVSKVAVWLPVTDEQLEDVPQAEAYVNNRLPLMLRQKLQAEIISGEGASPELDGFLSKEGLLTQAKGEDATADAIYKAMVKVEVEGQAVTTAVAINPKDWQDVRLMRTEGGAGLYIWGDPSVKGPETIWGVPVAKVQALPEGTALLGDFQTHSELVYRKGIELKVSDSHGEFFVENKQAIRAELRAALAVYRPAAFCEVTGV